MATSKGVIQGYCGVAAVDGKHQIVVETQAHGSGAEQELLLPVVTALTPLLTENSVISADAGYHSEANLRGLEEKRVDALIADNGMRQRDERFADQGRHKANSDPLHDKSLAPNKAKLFAPERFTHDAQARICLCPAGKSLQRSGTYRDRKGLIGERFRGRDQECARCPLKAQCLRHPDKPKGRQVTFFTGKDPSFESATDRMKRRIDSPEGRRQYGRRLATVEPVFANLRHNKQLNRFTLRGRAKVDTQWKLYCLVHNIEKLANFGKLGERKIGRR